MVSKVNLFKFFPFQSERAENNSPQTSRLKRAISLNEKAIQRSAQENGISDNLVLSENDINKMSRSDINLYFKDNPGFRDVKVPALQEKSEAISNVEMNSNSALRSAGLASVCLMGMLFAPVPAAVIAGGLMLHTFVKFNSAQEELLSHTDGSGSMTQSLHRLSEETLKESENLERLAADMVGPNEKGRKAQLELRSHTLERFRATDPTVSASDVFLHGDEWLISR